MFWVLVAAYLLISMIASPMTIWLVCRVFRRPASVARCVLCGVLQLSIAVGLFVADTGLGHRPLTAGISIGGIVALVLGMKWTSRARWGRTVAMFVVWIATSFAVSLSLGYGIAFRFMRTYYVPTAAMTPTISPGDRILVDRIASPKRWDLVVFRPPTEPSTTYVKRLIGLPGETIEIVNEGIRVNGAIAVKPNHLSWLHHRGDIGNRLTPGNGCTGNPITLGTNEYYMLGDNTDQSLDSRFWGPPVEPGTQPGAVAGRNLIGVVRATYAPFSRARFHPR